MNEEEVKKLREEFAHLDAEENSPEAVAAIEEEIRAELAKGTREHQRVLAHSRELACHRFVY